MGHYSRYIKIVNTVRDVGKFFPSELPTDNSSWYNVLLPTISSAINCDVFTPSLIHIIRESIAAELMKAIPQYIQLEAEEIFRVRNSERRGSWVDVGAVGALIEIHAKLSRLRAMRDDRDSLADLFNYCVIVLMCLEMGLVRPGDISREARTALVTGSGQGLGETVSQMLELNGYTVLNMARPSADTDTMHRELRDLTRNVNRIDVVINNFGTNHLNWLGCIDQSDSKVLINNLWIPVLVVDAVVALGLGPCKIINVASQTYRVAQRCTTVYCASKAGLVQATRVMARELAPEGYVVNAIAPGMIKDTRMSELTNEQVKELRGWSDEQMAEYALNYIPMGRHTDREEVATAILKMINLPDYINGAVIDMTGGQ